MPQPILRLTGRKSERELAHAINGAAPGVLAEEAARLNALFIHYSTDYVFDGSKASPWLESDAPNPINVYDESKLVGERAVAASGGRHYVFRTSWVYASHGQILCERFFALHVEREELRIVDDQIGAPTSAQANRRSHCAGNRFERVSRDRQRTRNTCGTRPLSYDVQGRNIVVRICAGGAWLSGE